ncbi:MAG TPA: cysteine--tRNA ligase, partial [Alcanivorax sp.]|nr:cysteine--tRNA ligase [Alcanivorax sp.]
ARNITDIDDKIITACAETGEPMTALTERFTDAFREDMAALNTLQPDIVPKATDHIGEMTAMIETLITKGHAYEADGHVLFAVESMPDYGKLSGRNLEDMRAGARVEVADYKRHPGDFVLWKPSSDDQPGWESPWGRGRPGWHIECSAMIHKHLGDVIDIHGGGQDLIFPHHENEIAQGCCAHGTEYVRYWMHNGYINIDGEKMSKSLGNFRLVRDLLEKFPGEVLRFALLSSHYRSPLNFSAELLEQAESSLDS